jgi:predicted  nucleic acid-binding Zn-ribbon protein
MTADGDLRTCNKAKDGLERELHEVREKMSNNEQHKGDAGKRTVELGEKRAALKAQKEKLEKELQNIGNEIAEKERAINALNKANSANRERKVS